MTHGSLFSGIGGFDLAAQWMGWTNLFHCEWNPFGQKVLNHYWPEAESFTDITKTDFTPYANRIDILTGGFPCQPYSLAGKRLGKEDERHLWPHMLRAIREIQPRWIVGENVFGLVNWSGGLVFHEVQTDLEAAGYEVWPYVLPACATNAPHRRDRIWFVAHAKSSSSGRTFNGSKQEVQGQFGRIHSSVYAADTESFRMGRTKELENNKEQSGERRRRNLDNVNEIRCKNEWSNWPTQSPLCTGNDGIPARLDTTAFSFSKWRNESIKAAGNAIVPQVAYEIFKAIQAYENL